MGIALFRAAFNLSIEYSFPRLDEVDVILEQVDDNRSSYKSVASYYFFIFYSYSAIHLER